MRWFSLGWFPFDNAARANNLMTKAIALFPEVEAWFVSKKLGPHLRFFGFRKAATRKRVRRTDLEWRHRSSGEKHPICCRLKAAVRDRQ
jgi:hypothetical protein